MLTTRRNLLLASLASAAGLKAQQSQSYVPRQSDRPQPMEGDEAGFRSIFDGRTLNGWEGDPKYWRAAGGVMTGEITPETIIKSNTFLIWRGGEPEDFELKVDYRITSGGNTLTHSINSQLMAIVLDDDPARERKGLIGVQVHVGGPMKIEYRNWRIR